MKITHGNLVHLGIILGYKFLEKGLCAGFSGMWMQAVLANDEASFYRRLSFIAEYIDEGQDNFQKLAHEIIETKKKVKEKILITVREQELLNILSFYDGIQLYLWPMNHNAIFNTTPISQCNLKEIFSITKSTCLEQKDLSVVFEKTYCSDKNTLIDYMNLLKEILLASRLTLPMTLDSHAHSVCFKYDLEKNGWIYLDANNLQYQALATSELVDCIFSSFAMSSCHCREMIY